MIAESKWICRRIRPIIKARQLKTVIKDMLYMGDFKIVIHVCVSLTGNVDTHRNKQLSIKQINEMMKRTSVTI